MFTTSDEKKTQIFSTFFFNLQVIPAITFSYQCHVSAIPVYSCMKKRTLKSFSVVACSAVLICVTCYSAAATWGYLVESLTW